ncbi:unnamed protein product [Protopolystoma xenopodis]|uniref:Uncharacterized protein n=1 Tax=Protopolystoma xenopodis TaxID=117903 RepID=A0A3S5APP7_9PLAT|nr:unnamed protein product [Protopolystoma xenopodis]
MVGASRSPVSCAIVFGIPNIGPLVHAVFMTNFLFNRCVIIPRPYFLFYLLVPHLFVSTTLHLAHPLIHTIMCSHFLQFGRRLAAAKPQNDGRTENWSRRLPSRVTLINCNFVLTTAPLTNAAAETFENVPSQWSTSAQAVREIIANHSLFQSPVDQVPSKEVAHSLHTAQFPAISPTSDKSLRYT